MRVIFHIMVDLSDKITRDFTELKKSYKNKILVHLFFLTSSNPVFSSSSQCQARVHGGIQQTVVSNHNHNTADQVYFLRM